VALLEATSFDGERYGETLPPEINAVLGELGLWQAFESLGPCEAPGIVSIWGESSRTNIDFLSNPYGPGWHIDRNRFDAMLCAKAAATGAELFLSHAIRKCVREGGRWRLGEISARMLVDASGRNGLPIGRSRELQVDDRLLAIVLRIGCPEKTPTDLRTYIEAAPKGWWYTAPLPNGRMIAMFFTDRVSYALGALSLEEQLRQAPLTLNRLQSSCVSGRRVLSVPSFCARRISGEDWVLVGDSASSYDPLSGRGIFKALRHASAAAAALDCRLRGDPDGIASYASRVRREFTAYARQRRSFYAIESRWSNLPFWRARRAL
jgi:flavin-dependent dehydrogenase